MTLVHCVDIGTFGALAHCAGGDIPGVILPILAGQPHSWTQGHSFSLSEHCEPGGEGFEKCATWRIPRGEKCGAGRI